MSNPSAPPAPDPETCLAVLQRAQRLKDTLRSGRTADGRAESTAEHSWALCLLVLLCEPELERDKIDILRLLKLCILHDLGEAITGDTPAIDASTHQDKGSAERAGLQQILAGLPLAQQSQLLDLWDEYCAGQTREAALAKGFDKIETMAQHVYGAQATGFDYEWNLAYGRRWTDHTIWLAKLRAALDTQTRAAAGTASQTDRKAP